MGSNIQLKSEMIMISLEEMDAQPLVLLRQDISVQEDLRQVLIHAPTVLVELHPMI